MTMKKGELSSLVERKILESRKYSEDQLGKQYEEALDFYQGIEPKRSHKGSTSFISNDTYDQVESLRAMLLEVFAGNDNLIKLEPKNPEDVPVARVTSEYLNNVVFKQNDGYGIFSSSILDGLLGRIGPVKYWWSEEVEEILEEFGPVAEEQYDMLIAMEGIRPDVVEKEIVVVDGLEYTQVSGTVIREKDVSQVRLESIPPEDFLIDPNVSSLEDALFVAQRCMKTKSDLLDMGFAKKDVDKLSFDKTLHNVWSNQAKQARFQNVSDSYLVGEDGTGQEATGYTWLYECYLELDMEDDGSTDLYQVFSADSVVLSTERVDRKPFAVFTPLPMSHRFYGESFTEKVIPFQKAKTALIRGVVDSTVRANNPRYQVIAGSLTNPRELLDNRMGGLVNVNRPDAIAPLPVNSINPISFSVLQWLDSSMEEVTGVSDVTKGADDSILSKQNSRGMVQDITTLAMQRQRVIAKNFAESFLKPLVMGVYETLVGNDTREHIIQYAGEFVSIEPEAWESRKAVSLEFEVGYGEKEKEANKLLAMSQLFSQDEHLSAMFGDEQRMNFARDILEKQGIVNVNDYLSPEAAQQKQEQAGQAQQMQQQIMERQLALEEQKIQLKAQQLQQDAQKSQHDASMDVQRLQLDTEKAVTKADLDQEKLDWKKKMDALEAQMLKMAEDVKGIVAINN